MTVCGHKADGVCVMGKCPYVKVCTTTVWDKTPQKPITNEEWLRSCTTEELAGAIYEWHSLGHARGVIGRKLDSITTVVEWLKEMRDEYSHTDDI